MANELFTTLNSFVEGKLNNPELTQGSEFNYYKVVQHALVYSHSEATNKLISNRIGKSMFEQRVLYALKGIIRKKIPTPKLKSYVIIEGGRASVDEEGKYVSVFFHHLKSLFDKSEYSIVENREQSELEEYDVHLSELQQLSNRALAQQEVAILRDINNVYRKIAASKRFSESELHYISSAFHIFFEDYHRYYQLLSSSHVKIVFSESHYHKEGLIAATKQRGIKFVELQHGLISRKDLYYVYGQHLSGWAEKALFPDKVFVFGAYWKSMLLDGSEHKAEDVIITGDYSYSQTKEIFGDKQNIVFIGAQKNMGEYYVPYMQFLLDNILPQHPEWEVWVKLHPFEKNPAQYHQLGQHPKLKIFGNESSLHHILSVCKIQISIYSTTFYDALGYDVLNLSLQSYSQSADYAADMVSEGIALALKVDEDPIEKYTQVGIQSMLHREDVYAPFDPAKFKKTILGFS
ncbi:MAG: hypothetical protein NWR73_03555 [Flavobacteriales bacterium]|nr:hypothetical protein [Flavobacteriales bacterium]